MHEAFANFVVSDLEQTSRSEKETPENTPIAQKNSCCSLNYQKKKAI